MVVLHPYFEASCVTFKNILAYIVSSAVISDMQVTHFRSEK